MIDHSAREQQRLAALAHYDVLDTPREKAFDDITGLVAAVCEAPIAIVNLIGEGRQFFKSETGLGVRETPLDTSFCAHAILERDFLLVPDATKDPRFSCNPLVTGEPHLRFYAGALLKTTDGLPVGTLCVLDYRPRELTEVQQRTIRVLADQVMVQLEHRIDARRIAASESRQRAIVESARDFAIIATDPDGRITDWNSGAEKILGWTAAEIAGQDSAIFFTQEDRDVRRPQQEMQLALEVGRAPDERWHLRKDGGRFWASGEMMPLNGSEGDHLGFVKILRDRTHEHFAGVTLEETQERYRLAARATNDAVWDWAFSTNQVLWNEALLTAYGHALEDSHSTGDWWIGQIHPGDRDRIDRSIHEVIDGGKTAWSDEYRFQRADGSYADVLDRGHVIRDEHGQAVRMIGAMLDLTRIRTAEKALRESEERFRTILDTVDAAFAIVEVKFDAEDRPVDYRFVEANPAFERQSGVNLRGKWVTEFAPDLEQFWFDTYGRVAKTREPANFENYASNFDRWFDVRAVPVGDPADRQIAILFNDTTARRQAEERLRESEALALANIERVQLALAAGAIIGTWHWDLPTDRFTVDEGFAIAFGLDPAMGRSGLSLSQVVATVHPDDQPGLAVAIEEVIARGGQYAHQYRVRRADGRYHWIEANGRVEKDAAGTAVTFPGVILDVEERREAERRLRESEEQLRLTTEAAELGLWDLDLVTDTLYWPPRVKAMFGISPDVPISMADFRDGLHPDDRERTNAALRAAIDPEIRAVYDVEYRTVGKEDGVVRWIAAKGRGVFDDAGTCRRILGTAIDISTRKAVEQQLYELNERLEQRVAEEVAERGKAEEALRQSQKMEAVGQLTGGIAHDFNNMLTGVIGSLDLIQRNLAAGKTERVERYLDAANTSAQRAAALTARLLAFGRRQSLDLVPIEVNTLVSGLEDLLHRTLGEQVLLETHLATNLWSACSDASQLENAIVNLCINARDAMPDGGKLTIETANTQLDRRYADAHPDVQPGDYVVICVSDTGIGMSAETLGKVFEPFFTTKPIGQGTGLGLSMIYGFARQSDGHVRIYSELGEGTTVKLYLPRHNGEQATEAETIGSAPRGAGETVMIVEDDASVRLIVLEVLEELGYHAIEAVDGRAALPILESGRRIDLLVTDVGLPGMNGRQLAEVARETRPDLGILFITGYAQNAAVRSGFLAEGMEMLTKPFAVEALATKIREMLEK